MDVPGGGALRPPAPPRGPASARGDPTVTASALLLDCDGTLVDSETLANEVLHEEVRARGLGWSLAETARRFTGVRIARCAEQIEREAGCVLPPSWVADLRARMDAAFEARLRPVEGAEDLLRALRLPHCVASGGRGRRSSGRSR